MAIPALLIGVLGVGDLAGHPWNIHGDAALLAIAFLVSILVGAVVSAVTLSSLIPALRRHPSLRTPLNLACTAVSGVFLALCLALLCFYAAQLSFMR